MTINNKGTEIWFTTAKYYNGNLAIQAWCDEGPYARMTVNLDEKLPDDEAYVDTNNWDEVMDIIKEYNLGKYVGIGFSGFCVYPKIKFNLDELKRYEG